MHTGDRRWRWRRQWRRQRWLLFFSSFFYYQNVTFMTFYSIRFSTLAHPAIFSLYWQIVQISKQQQPKQYTALANICSYKIYRHPLLIIVIASIEIVNIRIILGATFLCIGDLNHTCKWIGYTTLCMHKYINKMKLKVQLNYVLKPHK